MSCSCKTVIILIIYLPWASTPTSANTRTECEHTAVFALDSTVSVPDPSLRLFLWISCQPWSLSFPSIVSVCLCFLVSFSAVLSDLRKRMSHFMFVFFFQGVFDLPNFSKLGQHLHLLPCPCVLFFLFFRYAKYPQLNFKQALFFRPWSFFSLLLHLPLNISSLFSSFPIFFLIKPGTGCLFISRYIKSVNVV